MLRIVTIACAVVILIGAIVLWPSGDRTTDPLGLQADPQDAHVTAVEELPCTSDPNAQCAVVTFEVRSGARAGEVGRSSRASTRRSRRATTSGSR